MSDTVLYISQIITLPILIYAVATRRISDRAVRWIFNAHLVITVLYAVAMLSKNS